LAAADKPEPSCSWYMLRGFWKPHSAIKEEASKLGLFPRALKDLKANRWFAGPWMPTNNINSMAQTRGAEGWIIGYWTTTFCDIIYMPSGQLNAYNKQFGGEFLAVGLWIIAPHHTLPKAIFLR